MRGLFCLKLFNFSNDRCLTTINHQKSLLVRFDEGKSRNRKIIEMYPAGDEMSDSDLKLIVKELGTDLKVIDKSLNSELEVVEFIKNNGLERTPILFTDVDGQKVATNFVSTRELLCRYLRTPREELVRKLAELHPINVKDAVPVKNMRKTRANLENLPILRYFKNDGGKYITGGVVCAQLDGIINLSIHRIMVTSKDEGVIRLVPPRHLYSMHKKAVERGDELRITVAIGVHPLALFTASTRTEEGLELGYLSALKPDFIPVYTDYRIPMPPAEIILEGRITQEKMPEGPFVDITGTYDKVRDEPVVKFDRMYLTDDPIYYSITPGMAEHQILMGIPYEPVIYREVSKVCNVVNTMMTAGSRHYLHAIVQIIKSSEGDGKNAILAAFTAHPSLKHVVVVDEDIDIFSMEDVEYALATRFRGDKDLVIIRNVRGSSLDPTADDDGTTTKIGFDATKSIRDRERYGRVV